MYETELLNALNKLESMDSNNGDDEVTDKEAE